MSAASSKPPVQALHALRQDMRDADDRKIRQIVALLDGSQENATLRAVLDPFRPRLATLKPTRLLRFTRLLFFPVDDLIVPVPEWRPGHATIPRSVVKSMSNAVRIELRGEAATIDRMCGGHNTDDAEVIALAGDMLWGRAAEILAKADPPPDWEETGLRPALFAPIARAIATVLRRATLLLTLLRDAELGVLDVDEQAIRKIIANMTGEPPEGCAMVFKLILGRLPHAAPLLRRLAAASGTPAERTLLLTATDRGTEDIIFDMESLSDLTEGLREGPLAAVGTEVQRIAGLLQDISDDSNAARHRARLIKIREKLHTVCRERFVDGMTNGLIAPLAVATAAVDSAGQQQLETCARNLRTVEMAGRKLGNPSTYDALLCKASETVQAAAQSGNLGAVRALRLVEILSGPEAAEAMYQKIAGS